MSKLILIMLIILGRDVIAQPSINKDLLNKPWPAKWISVPQEESEEYGVYHFRKVVELETKPDTFIIHISADNRYKLYINETLASLGPTKGDLNHWNYETVNIAPFLKRGKNTIAAIVWNFAGENSPSAQISFMPGFILQGNSRKEEIFNSNNTWKCLESSAYSPIVFNKNWYFTGAYEKVDFKHYPWDWQKQDFNDKTWLEAKEIEQGIPENYWGNWGLPQRHLTPSGLPPMERKLQRIQRIRKTVGISIPKGFPENKMAFSVPSSTKAVIILDQNYLTNAYPVLHVSRGKGAVITIKYAEALFHQKENRTDVFQEKRNRNEVEGKLFLGPKDAFICDGGENRTIETLGWRTYRFIELTIETGEEPLVIEDFYGIFTGYPFELVSHFNAGNDHLNKILEVGWRTARLCAFDTYMDCPTYEQLQYIGDTRIQGLISIYNSGDTRLLRKAIEQIRHSINYPGITMSRYPSKESQYIPPFSLFWIAMLHDYWTYAGDASFVRSMLPGSRSIVEFFSEWQKPNGSLKTTPYWNFTDWVKEWKNGVPPINDDEGNSSILDLQLLMGLQYAARLEEAIGEPMYAQMYTEKIDRLSKTVKHTYWDDKRKLFSDTPEMKYFSQHANILAVLTGITQGDEARTLMEKVLTDTTLSPCTIYFKYYLHDALYKAGLGDKYLELLNDWDEQLKLGLTTWAESPEPSRSDCHAWGSSPNIGFYRIVLGIDAEAPGFSKVKIAPNLGKLKHASGSIPHPKGNIKVSYKLDRKGQMKASIELPPGVSGTFRWKNKVIVLHEGRQDI